MVIDSNIIICGSQPEHARLREFIAAEASAVSAVSYIEVLGYRELTATEKSLLREFFSICTVLPIDQDVLDQAYRSASRTRYSWGMRWWRQLRLCIVFLWLPTMWTTLPGSSPWPWWIPDAT